MRQDMLIFFGFYGEIRQDAEYFVCKLHNSYGSFLYI